MIVMNKAQVEKVPCVSVRTVGPLFFIGPQRLKRLAHDACVQVDSSTVCAYLHCRWGALQNKKRSVALAKRFFDMQIPDGPVHFGSFVSMTISELKEVFGSIDEIPVGVVRYAEPLARNL